MGLSSPLSIGRARSDATASLTTAKHFAGVGKPLLQAAHITSASWSLQRSIPRLMSSEAADIGREILGYRAQALGLYLSNGGQLDAARELNKRALLYEQLYDKRVNLQIPADPSSQVPATDLLRLAQKDRLESIGIVRQLPQPQNELASLLSYAAKTIHLLLQDKPQPDAAELVDSAISFRVEAEALFEKRGKHQDTYFENKFLAPLYMKKAEMAIEMKKAETAVELWLKASAVAEKAVDLAREKHIPDENSYSLYHVGAIANRKLAKQARESEPPDQGLNASYRKKAVYFEALEFQTQRTADAD
jgi:hypothetical protein